jgi:Rieske Fe-S protein
MALQKKYLLLLLLLIPPVISFSQQQTTMNHLAEQLQLYADKAAMTNLYLQTDRGSYETGEDLWFKGYVLDAQLLVLSDLDKTGYVQLQKESNDSIVWQEMYPIKNGIVSGHIYLDNDLPEGDYCLKAYSAHSFYGNSVPLYALRHIRVVKDAYALIKKSVPTTTAPKNTHIKLHLFPEGGRLIAGMPNLVAFKALSQAGLPTDVTGVLLKGNIPIQSFKSVHAGMGSFTFTPESGVAYSIRLDQLTNDSSYALPPVSDSGMVMHLLKNESDSLSLYITSNYNLPQRIYVRLQLRGVVQAIATGLFSGGLTVKFPVQQIAQGIAEVTLFDEQCRPLSERLVYINPDKKLHIDYQLAKDTVATREKIALKIKATDGEGKPVVASLGLSIFSALYNHQQDGKDIDNHYYLSSQLKGNIYDPAYYYDENNKDRKAALDLLLLTQGWRCYTWNTAVLQQDSSTSQQLVSDSIIGHFIKSGNKRKSTNLAGILLAFNAEENAQQPLTMDSSGRFFLRPEILSMGRRIYIKYFGETDATYTMSVTDPFILITNAAKNKAAAYPIFYAAQKEIPLQNFTLPENGLFSKTLNSVEIKAKGAAVTWPKYLGKLDSIAKLEGNHDYVGVCGHLNCPACGSGKRPVEGVVYSEYTGKRNITSHPFYFTGDEMTQVTYHYPTFTEEELLKKFKLAAAKGYYSHREFYQPDDNNTHDPIPDFRKTLVWLPNIITDEQGVATVSFFCSDITGTFSGKIEGISEQGLIGKKHFTLKVLSHK